MKNVKNKIPFFVLITAILLVNSLTAFGASRSENFITTRACSHSWTAWSTSDVYLTPGPTFDSCKIRNTVFTRGCTKCGNVQYKTVSTQLQHNWITGNGGAKLCTNCGMTLVPARNK